MLYTEENAENIKLYGRGIIDGNGHAMRTKHNFLSTIVMPVGCSDFTMDGITLLDGGFWSFISARSNDVTVTNTKHLNENINEMVENDAIDICESQNIILKHILAISEDDTYSTKTWGKTTDLATQWYGDPENNDQIVFDDCFGWPHCATFKVGDGNHRVQSNITFKNSYSYKSMATMKLTHGYGGGVAENITFDNIDIEGYGGRWANTEKWLDFYQNGNGSVKNITVKNINIRTMGKSASTLKGKDSENFYDGVTFENIFISGSSTPAKTLQEMNITDTNSFVKNIVILPASD